MGNMSQAIDYSLLVKDRLELLDNKREYAETLMILSIAYSQDNKVKEALKYAREARKIFDEINDVHEIASIETNLGVIFAKGHNMEESFVHLNKALKLKDDINDDTIPDTKLFICDNYIYQGEYDKALEIVSSIMNELDYEQHLYRIKCFEYLFKIYSKKNDIKKAEETLLNAIKYLEALDYKKQLGDFCVITGKFYIEIGEKELALKFINRGLDIYKNLGIILNE
jgi:tetratricopeptide (TPR) repeat protein